MLLKLSPKKSSFVSGIRQGERCFITHPPTKSNMHQNKYFQFQKKLKKRTAASKGITMTSFTFTWLSLEFLLVVHMNLMQFMCNGQNHCICYAYYKSIWSTHHFQEQKWKKIIKRQFCLSFSLFICLFVAGNLF